ncbi:50S ribosomal protein L9 [Candidatus Velamenicoccus archaeovorus]|uniref:Large ribosomal subunit protein bL9 n=1 Tax=Velamenicoccus archaeovorus TaxID=1930593 RepID=A0A410P762_VELA1|nr:50S ribosomal protein L9 [Candidatus Velamenicoccus archaeovorus]
MKVVLRSDVPGIGKIGEVKQVKDGFARNFLLPQNLAVIATDHALKQMELEQKKRQARLAQERKKAEELAQKLNGFSLTITVEVNEEEKLYGSLTVQDIQKTLAGEGIDVEKKCIVLEAPLKALGIYDIDVRLHPEVTSKIKVWVVKK